MYDSKYAEQKYLEYQDIRCDDTKAIKTLREKFKGKTILLIGPGNNIKRKKRDVQKFIEKIIRLLFPLIMSPMI